MNLFFHAASDGIDVSTNFKRCYHARTDHEVKLRQALPLLSWGVCGTRHTTTGFLPIKVTYLKTEKTSGGSPGRRHASVGSVMWRHRRPLLEGSRAAGVHGNTWTHRSSGHDSVDRKERVAQEMTSTYNCDCCLHSPQSTAKIDRGTRNKKQRKDQRGTSTFFTHTRKSPFPIWIQQETEKINQFWGSFVLYLSFQNLPSALGTSSGKSQALNCSWNIARTCWAQVMCCVAACNLVSGSARGRPAGNVDSRTGLLSASASTEARCSEMLQKSQNIFIRQPKERWFTSPKFGDANGRREGRKGPGVISCRLLQKFVAKPESMTATINDTIHVLFVFRRIIESFNLISAKENTK